MQRLYKILVITTLSSLGTLPIAAHATSIYDVTYTYEDGYEYSFGMEFATNVFSYPSSSDCCKTLADLDGGKFLYETLKVGSEVLTVGGFSSQLLELFKGYNTLYFHVEFDTDDGRSYTLSDAAIRDREFTDFQYNNFWHNTVGQTISLRTETTSPVPEPSTTLLLVAGVSAVLAGSHRQRRRSKKLASA